MHSEVREIGYWFSGILAGSIHVAESGLHPNERTGFRCMQGIVVSKSITCWRKIWRMREQTDK